MIRKCSFLFFVIIEILVSFLICGCSKKTPVQAVYNYSLSPTQNKLVFPVDDNTYSFHQALFLYTDEKENEYLIFQNGQSSEILFYDLCDKKLVKRIKFNREGDNGVGTFYGFYFKNKDEIYLPSNSEATIYQVNDQGKILREIEYGEYAYPLPVLTTFAFSLSYVPFFFIDGDLYITQRINPEYGDKILDRSPTTLVVDTLRHTVKSSSFTFPLIVSSKEFYSGGKTFEYDYSRIFDGKQITYSFVYDEYIYITSIQNNLIEKVPVKSRYINSIKPPVFKDETYISYGKKICETESYGNLIYDKYRDVYYRFAYPKTEMEELKDYFELFRFGRKCFSIIILDHDFNIIGETPVFQDYSYVSRMFFVAKDGLYICNNNPFHENYDENVLSFQQFELQKTR